MTIREPDHIDAHVGRRVRALRLASGLSQEALAGHLGVTFQQVQKYEKGINRMGAGRLYEIAGALGVPVGALFDGLEQANGETAGTNRADLELLRACTDLTPEHRHALLCVARAMNHTCEAANG